MNMLAGAGAVIGGRVMVVEDDQEIRHALAELLREEGHTVVTCANGQEALTGLREAAGALPDVILLDLMMPGMDGWQFRLAQKRDSALAGIPVVALSADSSAKAATIDAYAFLAKPVDARALLATIERVLLQREREQMQARMAQTDRMAALGTLAAGVAHEINNPLTFVIANLSVLSEQCPLMAADCRRLLDRPSGGPAQEPLTRIVSRLDEAVATLKDAREGAERIRGVVRDLATLSRSQDETLTPTDVRKLLDSSINIVMNEIRQRAQLEREYREVPLVMASAGRLGQVFLNLIVNAVQAIAEGDPTRNRIRVTTQGLPGHVLVEISDTGTGIPPEILPRIFDPFFTTKPIGVGTGLGLAICHGIVTALRGDITVESTVGVGTTFRVTLPATALPEPRPRTSSRTVPPRAGAKMRVLIIDDEPALARALAAMLQPDCQVTTATAGRDGLERLARGEVYDLVFCDLVMPEVTGMDIYEQIKLQRPQLAERFVFMTGGAFTTRAREFLEQIENPCIAKPFGVEEIRALVGLLRGQPRVS